MKILAPAKINLFLEITGKKKTGQGTYHTLNTIFQTVNLCDEIVISPGKSHRIDFTCDWTKIGIAESSPVEDNLCFRAASALMEYLEEKKGARIKLVKKIPAGAGLGGGSSDAAAVLIGLLKFWNRKIDKKNLNEIALKLGADVPFFLYGGCCFAQGVGEKLTPLRTSWEKEPLNIVLVKPGFSKSTGDVYKRYDERAVKRLTKFNNIPKIKREKLVDLNSLKLVNSLEEVVFEKYPELKALKCNFINMGACASLMSGSGTTIFGVFENGLIAQKSFVEFKKNGFNAWLIHTLNGGALWKSQKLEFPRGKK
ncbi:MAG: 4-(cytidine 5'-diphospho)-2-C-methyl-D-erythritol kinase [Elusimicrobia bacterium]|nr:4-(cytidine 5'-diphospho)-2-C-methyl-D-erythritol kinase [Elusimicrobiota bacterium]MBU2614175.1 4-(cytidine 5'-diphospho)-2-C-methyl-D-erythritol kinase [Elusimicrobiota bacterium]